MAVFSTNFWHDISKLGIYSKEAEDDAPMLADQMDSKIAGGANASDTDKDPPKDDGMGDDIDLGGDDLGGDMGGAEGGDDMSSDTGGDAGGDDSVDAGTEQTDPNENPFKGPNGRTLLDNKLAELETAVSDTLERIYANPRVEHVVVSELENLADSIKHIRDTLFIVPVDASLYKYQLSTTSYSKLAGLVVSSLKEK